MKVKAAIFYKGFIAYYSIYLIERGFFKAKLDSYRGELTPPLLVELNGSAGAWNSDCREEEVVKELGAAISQNEDFFYRIAS
ncbi:hypothetical protein V9K67_07705 [Paraflavisolibacter sp. H34]|uniref:hypothetical protein n=1 Tax=Huijunlia imazamoxiresistens TaxID=3127457 RepID=UPI003015B1A6